MKTETEADVMERAHEIIRSAAPRADFLPAAIARALTEYGDQRAREARDSLREQGYCVACGVYHRVGNCEAVENTRREARAAAIEEAAQVVEEHSKSPVGITWGKLETAIRALVSRSEGRQQ